MKTRTDEEKAAEVFGTEKATFVKIEGQKFPYQAINVVKQDGWIEFDRVNSKTGQVVGHLSFPMSQCIGIETR